MNVLTSRSGLDKVTALLYAKRTDVVARTITWCRQHRRITMTLWFIQEIAGWVAIAILIL